MTESNEQASETGLSPAQTIVSSAVWERNIVDTPVYAITSAVAEAVGADPLELPPLGEVIDTEALNTLFTSESSPAVRKVTFQYAGYVVVVTRSGDVQVRSLQDG